jgi:hypothetical protein
MSDYCTAEHAAPPVATEATPDFLQIPAQSDARASSTERPKSVTLGVGGRFGNFVTDHELAAHFRVLDIVAARRACPGYPARRSTGRKLRDGQLDKVLLLRLQNQLLRFTPRCNCGAALLVKPEIGRRLVRCSRCDFHCLEAK